MTLDKIILNFPAYKEEIIRVFPLGVVGGIEQNKNYKKNFTVPGT